ncbi:hypothetical protein LSCM1_02734 [Leishmania martiniquensis]|uniref:Uncharacterized protein n=1 Tax=Leishmania martiniquensis TaxID=1580590 RepID=A0A836H264_9TRYP|nr:hypothetical protein LSCM1_02734 [Leishmania martiniquensis]
MSTLLGFREGSPTADAPVQDDTSFDDSASQASYTTSNSRSSSGSIYSNFTSATENEAYQNIKLELDVAQENLAELHQRYEDLQRTSNYTKGKLETELHLLRIELQRYCDTDLTSTHQENTHAPQNESQTESAEQASKQADEHAAHAAALEAAKAAAEAKVQELEAAAAMSAEQASKQAAEHAAHAAALEAAKAAAEAKVQELEEEVKSVMKVVTKDKFEWDVVEFDENKLQRINADRFMLAKRVEDSVRVLLKDHRALIDRLSDEVVQLHSQVAAVEAEKSELLRKGRIEEEVRRRAVATERSGLLSGEGSGGARRRGEGRSWWQWCAVM